MDMVKMGSFLATLLVLCVIAWFALIVFISVKGMQIFLVSAIGGFLALMIYTILYNRMMAYVESRIYDWK